MKKGKKIVIGVAAVAVVAGGFYAVSGGSRGEAQLPQVSVTKAEPACKQRPRPYQYITYFAIRKL